MVTSPSHLLLDFLGFSGDQTILYAKLRELVAHRKSAGSSVLLWYVFGMPVLTVEVYWGSHGLISVGKHSGTGCLWSFKERWASNGSNKEIMVPIIIHYYIDHRVTFEEDRALFPLMWTRFTAPQCHLVATAKYTIFSYLNNPLYNYEHWSDCECNDYGLWIMDYGNVIAGDYVLVMV